MKKSNNKGFAVSSLLYGLLIIFILIILLLMSILSTNRNSTTKLVKQIEEELNTYRKEKTKVNKNIKVVYKYNETSGASNYCVSGEESTCEAITPTTYEVGTIIKYAVNNTEDKYFYVLHDDGNTLTMQQRENTVNNVAWHETAIDNTQGPITVLTALESATSTWTNVKSQTYTLGTTNFNNTNPYTGCNYSGDNIICNENTYTLSTRTVKARIITAQEAFSAGCTISSQTCPIWMYNYLYQSTSYGGSYNDNTSLSGGIYNNGYWTLSAYSISTSSAWFIIPKGSLHPFDISDYGARAVIVIDK